MIFKLSAILRIRKLLLVSFVLNVVSFSVIGEESVIDSKIPHSKQQLLFIGDSHTVGVFGHRLTNFVLDNLPDVSITTVASCGSDPKWWIEGKPTKCGFWYRHSDGNEEDLHEKMTPKLESLLNEIKPEVTIVALGTNLVPLNENERITYTKAMMTLLEKKGGRCIWIGPPDSRQISAVEINEVYRLLKRLSQQYSCKLIDSREDTKYPALGGDGLHYDGEQGALIAEKWAKNIFFRDIEQYFH
jgi:hypothetical protein